MDNSIDTELKRQLLAYCLANKGAFRGEYNENMKPMNVANLTAI